MLLLCKNNRKYTDSTCNSVNAVSFAIGSYYGSSWIANCKRVGSVTQADLEKLQPGAVIVFSELQTTGGASHIAVHVGKGADGNHYFAHSNFPDGTLVNFQAWETYIKRGYIGKGDTPCNYVAVFNFGSGADVIMDEGFPVRAVKEDEYGNRLSDAEFVATVNGDDIAMIECNEAGESIEKGIYGIYEVADVKDEDALEVERVYTELAFPAVTQVTVTEVKIYTTRRNKSESISQC